jgi:ATP-binding cassette, subfamily B, bacterial
MTQKLPSWRVALAMIRFRPGLWILNLVSMIVLMVANQTPGLVIREFFNTISQKAPARFDILTLVVFLFICEFGRLLGVFGLIQSNVPFFVHNMTLLRRNMLKHILKRPGAKALPDSPGEALSRFRGDVFELPLFALWLNNLQGMLVFTIIAVTVMCRVNVTITVLALLPFVVVGVVSNTASKQVEEYRRASRKATGIVSGFLGELFGSVQAIKVAAAEKNVIHHFRQLNEKRRKVSSKIDYSMKSWVQCFAMPRISGPVPYSSWQDNPCVCRHLLWEISLYSFFICNSSVSLLLSPACWSPVINRSVSLWRE